jgi:hypothetical protein
MAETDYLNDALNAVWLKQVAFSPAYANVYVGFSAGDPGAAGDLSTEVSGPGYSRKPVSFGDAPFANTNELLWSAEGTWSSVLDYVFLADSSQGGNVLNSASITTVPTPSAGFKIRIQVGALTVT